MEIFEFDRDERRIARHESVGVLATRIAAGTGPVHLTHLKVEAGGTIGTHPAPSPQMFLVISGDGWIAGPDGTRTPITAGQGVCWDQAEDHTSGTESGFTAIAVEGLPLTLFTPEPPEPPESDRPGTPGHLRLGGHTAVTQPDVSADWIRRDEAARERRDAGG